MNITAQDLKTRGATAIDESLKNSDHALISVRGKAKYVVVTLEEYEEAQDAKLVAAYYEAQNDIAAGKFHTDIEQHLREIKNAAI